MATGKMSLPAKMAVISKECGYVQKNGFNSFHKYKYASASDILKKVNEACAEQSIAVVSEAKILEWKEVTTSRGNVEQLVTVSVTLTIVDGDSDATLTATGLGTGQDAGDKAIAKAQTMAHKYAWMHTLNIATGDDPEADESVDERMHDNTTPPRSNNNNSESHGASEKQVKFIFKLVEGLKWTPDQAKEEMNKRYKVVSTKDLTSKNASDFIEFLQTQKVS